MNSDAGFDVLEKIGYPGASTTGCTMNCSIFATQLLTIWCFFVSNLLLFDPIIFQLSNSFQIFKITTDSVREEGRYLCVLRTFLHIILSINFENDAK